MIFDGGIRDKKTDSFWGYPLFCMLRALLQFQAILEGVADFG